MGVNEVTETLSNKEQMAWGRNFKAAYGLYPREKRTSKKVQRENLNGIIERISGAGKWELNFVFNVNFI